MINSEAVQQIGKLWGQAVDSTLAGTFPAIQQMSDTATEVVDRIIEATWTQGREIPLETMDQMRELAIAGDEAEATSSPEAVRPFAKALYAAYFDRLERAWYSGTGDPAMSTPPDDLGHASATENQIEFTTGKPVKFPYIHNTERAPRTGARFGQDIEPHGRYIQYHSHPDPAGLPKNMISGEIEFRNPLVIAHAPEDIYGPNGWKARLSRAFGGKRGKRLSQAIAAAGHDGIVTVDPKYQVSSEIVDLTMFHKPRGP